MRHKATERKWTGIIEESNEEIQIKVNREKEGEKYINKTTKKNQKDYKGKEMKIKSLRQANSPFFCTEGLFGEDNYCRRSGAT
jgi:hypothetical protein